MFRGGCLASIDRKWGVIDRDDEGHQLLPVIGLRNIQAVRIACDQDKENKKSNYKY